jgi:hypothetical protein
VIHSVNPRLRGAARIIWILIAKFFPCGKKLGPTLAVVITGTHRGIIKCRFLIVHNFYHPLFCHYMANLFQKAKIYFSEVSLFFLALRAYEGR